MRARKRQGSAGRGGIGGVYDTLGLFGHYRVSRRKQRRLKAAPGLIGRITLGMKRAGVRSAGNPHAAYDVAEAGDGVKGRSEAPALRKPPATATPIRLPQPRQSPTLLHYYSRA